MKERIFTLMAMPVLKLRAFALIVFFIFPVSFARAQDDALLYKEIQLSKKSYTFDELTHVIQKQAGITFTYNASQIKGNQSIRLNNQRITVVNLLAQIKKKSGIGYRMVSPGMIVYTPPANRQVLRKKRKNTTKKETVSQVKKETTAETKTSVPDEPKATETNVLAEEQQANLIAPEDSGATQTVIVIGDSATASSYYFGGGYYGGGGGMGNIQMVMRYPSTDENTINPYASLNPPGSKVNRYQGSFKQQPDIGSFVMQNLLLGAGVSLDETYYLNPGLYFGFRFLYAHVSYSLGAYPQWRYGLGAEARLNDKWTMRFEFNTGKQFYDTYSFTTFDTIIPPPPQDSITPPSPPIITQQDHLLSVQSQLTRFSFTLNRQLTKAISIGAGISFNRLRSRYYNNGLPFDIYSIDPPIANVDELFRTIKPPYLLSSTYQAASATSIQTWIGVKLSLFFNLNP